jgi:two-component system sensor histidine kinase KdpD
MTRLESGDLGVKREWVPVEEIIGAALTRTEALLAGRPVEVNIEEGTSLIAVDPVLVQQVFVNLLENAAKYTPAGSPIDFAARSRDGEVIIDVLDRGPGLDEGLAQRVFEKFERGKHAAGIVGAGLGLAICRGIVEAHGGTLVHQARDGGGSIFRVTLPIVGEPPEEEAEP